MKKLLLILFLGLTTVAYANSEKSHKKDYLHKNSKYYEEYKKQLIEQNKSYEEEKRKKNKTSDSIIANDIETIDFSTGKPIKK